MRLRIKQLGTFGTRRTDYSGRIDNVIVEENLLKPEKESISIFFRGGRTSGILSISTKELQSLIRTVQSHISLIKKPEKSVKPKKKRTPNKFSKKTKKRPKKLKRR